MIASKDYLREIQKFATSQYWNSGLRITAGVMLPLFILIKAGWIAEGIPFLWGALFVSLTDTPGPIHHRRNGMLAAIILNTVVVFITVFTKQYQALLIIQIVVAGFLLSMAGIYGGRAGAVGSLALVIMLLNLLTIRNDQSIFQDSLLIASGGTWYMIFSLMLYRLRPYRLVEQALGEHLITIADYIRARGAFYKEDANLPSCFNRIMEQQSTVQKIQQQTQELIFKTRTFVADPSPKSRSAMMIFLDSIDLFEETMYSYADYKLLHKTLAHAGLLTQFYGLILEVAAALEYIGISVQTGVPVKKDLDITARIDTLRQWVQTQSAQARDIELLQSFHALEKTLNSLWRISNRINRLALYTRLDTDIKTKKEVVEKISSEAVTQPVTFRLFRENFSMSSNTFRHATRITVAMIVAYVAAIIFSLTHPYWALLTIVTIMKPVYAITRKRNIQRVAGTLTGVLLVLVILYFIHNITFLLIIMVISMLVGYSFLRVNYFMFVVFLTVFVVLSFHFLNPFEFKALIFERLIDTVIGSLIAASASRFIFPVWEHNEIRTSLQKMLAAHRAYFSCAWMALKNNNAETMAYKSARKEAVVALTNLSENFQQMLEEPVQTKASAAIHQLVIASHMLTSHIAALSTDQSLRHHADDKDLERMAQLTMQELKQAEDYLGNNYLSADHIQHHDLLLTNQTSNQLVIIYNLSRDIRKIGLRL
jgi:uncharacterized membrane protein YccC